MKNILFFLFVFSCSSLNAQTQEQIAHLDHYYAKTLKEWKVPGMAIAIVKGDSVIFSKGYGYANLRQKKKVDPNTLFAIASNTKSFTATAIAKLVDEKKLKWDDKVRDYLPYFKMYDRYVTEAFTIEDLLCHRSGLETFSGDLLWYGTTKTPQEVIEASQFLEPKYGFRTHFGYSNIHFIVAGQIIEKVTGQKWKDYIQENFLIPLAMDRTLTSTNQIMGVKNIATPYFFEDNKNIALEWSNWDNVAPAGALISSVTDYAQWIKLNIKRCDGYISDHQFERMTTPHVNHIIGANSRRNIPSKHFNAYGLGWSLADSYGVKIISHGGGYDGMISKSCVIPEKQLGFIILTNSLNWVPSALFNKTIDVLIGNDMEGKNWSSDYLTFKNDMVKSDREKSIKLETVRDKFPKTFSDLAKYQGTYHDKMYGDMNVKFENGKLSFKMMETPIFYAELIHWNHDIFTFRFPTNLVSLPVGKLWFDLDSNGEIGKLHIHVPNPDFYFEEFEFNKVE